MTIADNRPNTVTLLAPAPEPEPELPPTSLEGAAVAIPCTPPVTAPMSVSYNYHWISAR